MFTYLLTIDVIISLYLFPYLYPSPISFMVSVDVKHHVYILTYYRHNLPLLPPSPVPNKPYGFCGRKTPCLLPYYTRYNLPLPHLRPSLISLIVSVNVKHHVYLKFSHLRPSIISLMVFVDVQHHVYLLTYYRHNLPLLPPSPVTNKPYGFCGRTAPCLRPTPSPVLWFLWT